MEEGLSTAKVQQSASQYESQEVQLVSVEDIIELRASYGLC